jgi:paired amphipathic helix protein Sin3a
LYLDYVKAEFADNPEAYSQFLNIMKDFREGVIDTPGVVERVSRHLQNSPALIEGFNTFLPPGYKLEIVGQNKSRHIRVMTPTRTVVTSKVPTSGQKRRVIGKDSTRRSKRRKGE